MSSLPLGHDALRQLERPWSLVKPLSRLAGNEPCGGVNTHSRDSDPEVELMGAFGDTPHVQSDLVAVVDCVDDVPEDTLRLVPGDPMPLKGSLVDT